MLNKIRKFTLKPLQNSLRARTIAPSVYPATRIYFTLTRWRNLKFAYRFSQVTEDMWYIDFYTRKFQKAEIIHLKLMNFVKIKKRYCGKVQLWTKCCKIDVQATGDGEILMIDFVIWFCVWWKAWPTINSDQKQTVAQYKLNKIWRDPFTCQIILLTN